MIRKLYNFWRLTLSCTVILLALTGAAFQYGGIRHDLKTQTGTTSTIVLDSSSTQVQVVTGSANQVIKLPDATTLQKGYWYRIINEGSGTLTVSNSSSTAIGTIAAATGTSAPFAQMYLVSNATTGGPWDFGYNLASGNANTSYFVASCHEAQGSCNWNTAGTSLGAFSTNSSCTTIVQEVNGSGSCGTTNSGHLPQVVVTVPSAGTYCARFDFRAGGPSSGRCDFAINDGTNTYGRASGIPTASTDGFVSVEACFNYAASGSKTFQLYGSQNSGSGNCTIHAGDDANTQLWFRLLGPF